MATLSDKDIDEVLGGYSTYFKISTSNNFRHIVSNLICIYNISGNNKKEESVDPLNYIKIYLELLDDFPEFKERELNQNTSDCMDSVFYVKEKHFELRQIKIN